MHNIPFGEFTNALSDAVERINESLEIPDHSEWFANLWERCADRYEFYELAKLISQQALGYELTLPKWETAWSKRLVLSKDLESARVEFVNAILGWW